MTATKAPLQLVCTDETAANVEAFTKADQAPKDDAEKLREANQRLKTLTDACAFQLLPFVNVLPDAGLGAGDRFAEWQWLVERRRSPPSRIAKSGRRAGHQM